MGNFDILVVIAEVIALPLATQSIVDVVSEYFDTKRKLVRSAKTWPEAILAILKNEQPSIISNGRRKRRVPLLQLVASWLCCVSLFLQSTKPAQLSLLVVVPQALVSIVQQFIQKKSYFRVVLPVVISYSALVTAECHPFSLLPWRQLQIVSLMMSFVALLLWAYLRWKGPSRRVPDVTVEGKSSAYVRQQLLRVGPVTDEANMRTPLNTSYQNQTNVPFRVVVGPPQIGRVGVDMPYPPHELDLITQMSSSLERRLEQPPYNSSGRGLHEKISNSGIRNVQLERKLRFLATIRNKVLHEGFRNLDRDRLIRTFEDCMNLLGIENVM